MKVKVIRKFRDRHTGAIYNQGIVLELTEERYREIMLKGNYVFKFVENETADDAAIDKPGDGLEDMSLRELKEYADKTYKLTFGKGTKKSEIIEAIRRMERNG